MKVYNRSKLFLITMLSSEIAKLPTLHKPAFIRSPIAMFLLLEPQELRAQKEVHVSIIFVLFSIFIGDKEK